MKEEEKFLSNIAIALLIVVAIAVELVLTITLLVLNALPSFVHGYFLITWIFIALYLIISTLWIGGIYGIISRQKRKRLIKALKGGEKCHG